MRWIIIVLILFSLVGCSSEVYIVTIDGERVSIEEYNIYLYEQKKLFEEIGGADIWNIDFDGQPSEQVARQNAMETLIYVRISALQAKKAGIYLTEDDKQQAIQEANTLMQEMTEHSSDLVFIEEIVISVMEDMLLFEKLYEHIAKDENEDEFELRYNEWRSNTKVIINESVFYNQ